MEELKPTEQGNEVITFDFSELGEKAEAAKELDNDFCDNADEAVAHAKKALRSFKRLHDLMANHYQGTWRRWLGFRNITKDDAARMLRKYDYVVANCDNADYILQLSETRGGKGLVDEAARPSTPQSLKDGVASGEVTTLAEFRRLKEQLEMARAENKALRANPQAAGAAASEELQAAQEAAARSEAAREAAVQAASEAQEKADNLSLLLEAEQKARADAERSSERLTQMATSLQATIQRQADELAHRPERETIVTRDVVPEDYEALKNENALMKEDLAKYEAHARGVSVQELATCEERFRDQQKTREDEHEAYQKVEKLLTALYLFPTANTAEIHELARCFLAQAPYRDEAVEEAGKNIERGMKILSVLREDIGYGQKLKVVK